MVPDTARSIVRLRRVIRGLHGVAAELEQQRTAGCEMPDVALEMQQLQATLRMLSLVQHRHHARIQSLIRGFLPDPAADDEAVEVRDKENDESN